MFVLPSATPHITILLQRTVPPLLPFLTFIWTICVPCPDDYYLYDLHHSYLQYLHFLYFSIFLSSVFTFVVIIWRIWYRSVPWLPRFPVTVPSFHFSHNKIVLCDCHSKTWHNANNHVSYFFYKLYITTWCFFDFVSDLGHQVNFPCWQPSDQAPSKFANVSTTEFSICSVSTMLTVAPLFFLDVNGRFFPYLFLQLLLLLLKWLKPRH